MKSIATILVTVFVVFLYLYDFLNNKPKGLSKGIIVPLIWIFTWGTRSISFWLNMGSVQTTIEVDDYMEGNPIDRYFYFFLIILGIIILYKRKIDIKNIIKTNKFVFLYFLFGLISILWSDYTFISFKRLIKAFGVIIMVLIVLTEENPEEALGMIIRYISFFYIPVSLLWVKYYPELGRNFAIDGTMQYVGISTQKNILGKNLLIIGIYYFWNFFYNKGNTTTNDQPIKFYIMLLILPILFYLFNLADSSTSLFCLVIGLFILLICKLPIARKNPGYIITRGLFFVLIIVILEFTLGISSIIIKMLGRDPSLTDRGPIWAYLFAMIKNPILGQGYESFWLGERLSHVWSVYHKINQAHNGYLETYLNLGVIGIIILIFQIISGIIKIKKQFLINYSFSVFKLTFLIIILFHSWTEASFHGPNNLWLIFFLSIMEIPKVNENVKIIKNE